MAVLLDVINSKVGGISSSKLVDETRIFRDHEKGFGRQSALISIKSTHSGMLLIKFERIFNFKYLLFYSLIVIYFVTFMWMSSGEYMDMIVQMLEKWL